MSINLTKLQKQMMIILNKIENEAVENGEDISSDEFQNALLGLKGKLLERKGLTLEEYDTMVADRKAAKKAEEDEPEEIELKIV